MRVYEYEKQIDELLNISINPSMIEIQEIVDRARDDVEMSRADIKVIIGILDDLHLICIETACTCGYHLE